MKRITALLALAGALLAPGASAATDSPTTPVRAFIAAFDKGDAAAARATHESGDVTIMDEVPPHIWQGAHAFDQWLTSLAAYDKAHGRTGGNVALSAPRVVTVEGNRGYVVAPAVYTFAANGRPMREPATMTFAVHRGAAGWKIAGWSWNGTVPTPAGK